jgi:acetyl/propionyl-CoA carboxylase alpha subunit
MRIGNDIQWFPTIDASLQLRFRKLLSFTLDDQALDPKARNRMFESGEKLLREVRYQGVGALEFLVEGDEAYFVEGISRLGMDFELWEHASETSMVEHQLLALGLICESPKRSRASSTPLFALHARFYAEDPLLGLPSPGQFDQVELPKIEEQTGFTLRLPLRTQTAISWEDSGFLGTLTLSGRDRKATMDHAIQVLRDLWLPGSVVTTQDFLVDLLEHPLVREDFIAAGFLEDTFIPRTLPDTKMMVQAASALGEIAESSRIRVGGVVIQADPRKVEWGELGPWSVLPQVEGRLPAWEGVLRDGTRLYAARVTEGRWMLRVGTWMGWARTRSEVPERGGSGVRSRPLLSQVAGKIHAILFLERARVQAREVMVLIECMGVLVPHAIPKPCRIERWEVSAEEVVKLGTCLATFELEG